MITTLRDIFKASRDVTKAFRDIVLLDDDIKNHINQVGTMGSLINVGLEVYNKYREYPSKPEQRAYSSILRIVFQVTRDLLKDIETIRSLSENQRLTQ